MGNPTENKPAQTPDQMAEAFRNSSHEHSKKHWVPVFIIAGFLAVDHLIPAGWPTKVEEVALLGYIFEFTRQAYLELRDSRRADEAEKLGRSTNNTLLTHP
jgi:hypothetical protein